MNSYRNRVLQGVVLLVCLDSPAWAIDRFAVEVGSGDESTERYGVAVQWDWGQRWLDYGNWFLNAYIEASLSHWDGEKGRTDNDSLIDGSITPVLRYQAHTPIFGVIPYLEGGVGLHGLSEDRLGDRDFGTQFAFGSHMGTGVRFGPAGRFDLGYRYQHVSNAGLADPNPGINFHLLRLAYHF